MNDSNRMSPADQFGFDQEMGRIAEFTAQTRRDTAALSDGEQDPFMPAEMALEMAAMYRNLATTITASWWKAQPHTSATPSFTETAAMIARRAAHTSEHGMEPIEEVLLQSIEQTTESAAYFEEMARAAAERERTDPVMRAYVIAWKSNRDGVDPDLALAEAMLTEPVFAEYNTPELHQEIAEFRATRAARAAETGAPSPSPSPSPSPEQRTPDQETR